MSTRAERRRQAKAAAKTPPPTPKPPKEKPEAAKPKHKVKNSAQKTQYRNRCLRLARQLTIHGKRLAGSDEDFEGGVKKPATMSRHDANLAYGWAVETPNRWWCVATAYFEAEDGTRYQWSAEGETGQQALANELSQQRRDLLEQAKSEGNPRHLVAEGYEMGVL